jgi:hypothetical protein
MYDYVKSKGYKIRRSGQQTDAGAGFWDKHRPEQNVWEQGVAGGSTETTQQQQVRAAISKGMAKWDQSDLATYKSQPTNLQHWDPSGWASGQLKGINSIDPDGTVVIELDDTTTAGLVKKLAALGGMPGVKTRQLQSPTVSSRGVAEARMSAAQRLWNAEQKQRAKSDASLARTPSSIPKPEPKKDEKTVPVSENVENIMSALINKIIVNEATNK